MKDAINLQLIVEPVGIKVLGNRNDLFDLIKKYEIDEVILAIPSAAREKIMDLILALRRRNIIYRIMPDLFELSDHSSECEQLRLGGAAGLCGNPSARLATLV